MSTLITDKVDNAAVQKKNWTPVRIYPIPLAAIFYWSVACLRYGGWRAT